MHIWLNWLPLKHIILPFPPPPPSYPHVYMYEQCKVVKCSTVNYAPTPAIFSVIICTCRLCHIIMIIISEIRKACKGPAKENEQTLCSREKEI